MQWMFVPIALISHLALADGAVEVTAEGATFQISARTATIVDRETAWQVLSDYGRWAQFLPNVTESRVLSRSGTSLTVKQRARIPWLADYPLEVIAQVQEIPGQGVRFRRLSGNVRSLDGAWQITGDSPVQLVYRSTVELGLPLPAQLVRRQLRRDTQAMLEAMSGEMARRAGHATRCTLPSAGMETDCGTPCRALRGGQGTC